MSRQANPYLVFCTAGPNDLDVWEHMQNFDNQALNHNLQRLKHRMEVQFDHQQMQWWNSDRTINLYTDNFVKQTYRHGDECLKRVLQHMDKQKRLTGDTRNVVEMSIQFLKQQRFDDLRSEQGAA